MNTMLRLLLLLPGALFIASGIQWLVSPAAAAEGLGMSLLTGVGLSTQIGDLSAFFLALGTCMVAGTITLQRSWFYAPILAVLLAVLGRLVAWLFHDAALATDLIAVEVIIAAVLWYGSWRLCERPVAPPAEEPIETADADE